MVISCEAGGASLPTDIVRAAVPHGARGQRADAKLWRVPYFHDRVASNPGSLCGVQKPCHQFFDINRYRIDDNKMSKFSGKVMGSEYPSSGERQICETNYDEVGEFCTGLTLIMALC